MVSFASLVQTKGSTSMIPQLSPSVGIYAGLIVLLAALGAANAGKESEK